MSRLRFAVFAGFMALLSIPIAATAGTSPSASEAKIRAENARWAEAYAQGDYATIGKLYTDDGMLLPPGETRVVGPAAIAAYFADKARKSGPKTITFSNYEFYGDGRMVTEISDTEIRDQEGNLISRGKQILIFVKKGATWKLHRDIWNASPLNAPSDN